MAGDRQTDDKLKGKEDRAGDRQTVGKVKDREDMKGDRQTVGKMKNREDMASDRQTDGITCDICVKSFKTKYGFKRHRKIHEERCKYNCQVCGAEFTQRDVYLRHRKEHTSQGKKTDGDQKRKGNDKQKPIIICKVCGQIFSGMDSFRVHKNKHLGKRYYCTRCAKSFTTTDQLKLHERDHDNVRSFKCSQCNSQFKRKSNLTRHIQQHEGKRRFVCHICGKAFVLNESLASHMKVHQTAQLLSCDICGATFKYENSLKTHKKIHLNMKDFKCKICSREFLRKRTLEDHLKVHEKGTDRKALFATPVEFCTLCFKGFANAYGLKRHMRKHRMGILKYYNRACGKNAVNERGGSNDVRPVKGHKEKSHHPQRVAVYSQIVDNGQLFEKIDPKCFQENVTDMVVENKSQCELDSFIESSKDIQMNDSLSLTIDPQIPKQQPENNVAAKGEDDAVFNETEMKSDRLVSDDASCSSLEASDAEDLDGHVPEELIDNGSLAKLSDIEDFNEVSQDFEVGVATFGNEKHSVIGNNEDLDYKGFERNLQKASEILGFNDGVESKNKNIIEEDNCPPLKIVIKRLDNDKHMSEITNQSSDMEHTWFKQNVADNGDNKNCNSKDTYDNSHGLVCSICNKTKHFKNKKSLISHMRKFHKGNLSCRFQCAKCLKTFFSEIDYENHKKNEGHELNNSTDDLNLECKFCVTKYASMASLKNHLHRYHKDEDGKIYRCGQCEKMFASKILYRNHVDSHTLGRCKSRERCECDICGTQYKTRCSLRRHKRVTHNIEEDEMFIVSDDQDDGEIDKCENNTEMHGQTLLDRGTEGKNLVEKMKQNLEGGHIQPELMKDGSCNILVTEIKGQEDADSNVHWSMQNKPGANVPMNNIAKGKRNEITENIHAENQVEPEITTNLTDTSSVSDTELNMTRAFNDEKESENHCYVDNCKQTGKDIFDKSGNICAPSACAITKLYAPDERAKSYFNSKIHGKFSKARFQRNFQCIKCNKTFHMMSTLKQHMLGHDNQHCDQSQLFSCDQCNRKFSKMAQLMIHTHKYHSKFTLTCNYCPRKFTSVSCLKLHKCIKLKQSNLVDTLKQAKTGKAVGKADENCVCSICGKLFTALCCLQVHMLTHTGHYQCDFCQAKFTQLHHFKRHKIDIHGLVISDATFLKCCKKSFLSKEDLQGHMRGHKKRMPFKCIFCSISLSSKSNLDRHLKLKHGDSHSVGATSANEMCSKCEVILFEEQLKLQSNIKIKTCEKTHQCQSCDEVFMTSSRLRTHLKDVHNIYAYLCNKCPKRFSTYSNLKRHESINHSDSNKVQRNFMCSECGNCFTAKDSLRVHMYSHTGERPYQCSICKASYSQSSHLRRHIKVVHESKLNYKCQYSDCDKSFYDQSVMRVHQRSHTDERPYTCPQCNSRFRTLNAKKMHMRTHSLNKQFECHICFQGLTTKYCLQQHLERHEAAEKMNPSSAVYDPNFKGKIRQKVVKKMEEKRYGCSFCSRQFTTTRGVYAHQRKYCGAGRDANSENNSRYYLLN